MLRWSYGDRHRHQTSSRGDPSRADLRVASLPGGVVSVDVVAGLVVLVALPVSIALFGWLLYRLLRPNRRP
jgi:hypothetical protein